VTISAHQWLTVCESETDQAPAGDLGGALLSTGNFFGIFLVLIISLLLNVLIWFLAGSEGRFPDCFKK
jgi:hypothetical protein